MGSNYGLRDIYTVCMDMMGWLFSKKLVPLGPTFRENFEALGEILSKLAIQTQTARFLQTS